MFTTVTDEALALELDEQQRRLQAYREAKLALDMSRGKPSPAQVDLSRPLLDMLSSDMDLSDGDAIVANYGTPEGLPSARRLAAEIMGIDPAHVIVSGQSSLNLMHDCIMHAYTRGVAGCTPWDKQVDVKFLCPAPGYDRHFAVTAKFGIKNVVVPMDENGPDMERVAELVENDPAVKGIWCVPKYANPTGVTYSDEVVRSLAALTPAAPDFRIYWDNAYAIHDVFGEDKLLNIFDELEALGKKDMVYAFGSFNKVTFPGSSIAYMAASAADLAELQSDFGLMRVCGEKIMQLAHARYFKTKEGVLEHMAKHAELLRPKFEAVERILDAGLKDLADEGSLSWTKPKGGYFVSFNAPSGSASKIVKTMADLGVKMTPAGATFPYGQDPKDANIRIAPTYPELADLELALEVFVCVVRCVAAEAELKARRSIAH